MLTASRSLLVASSFLALAACSDAGAPAGASASASAAKAPTLPASSVAAATPTVTASAAPVVLPPRSDCPKDSAGPGTLEQPCVGKGAARLMEAKWTGKTDDEKGPYFAVTNKSASPILYGKIAVFFYDKAGKQLEVKGKTKQLPYLVCAGSNLFSGIMKPAEKATLTFSCVKKSDIPEGTAAIEGEVVVVGFADATEKKSEFYWSNQDLAPEVRAKGGVK